MKNNFLSCSNVMSRLGLAALLLAMSDMAAAGGSVSVPEPGPMGLLVLGGVGLLIARRFRRNK